MEKASKYVFFTMVMLLIIPLVYSQDVPHILFTAEDGFPATDVYGDIIQDSMDYMWFPTDKGLYRYNGESFKKYPVGNKIADEEIHVLRQDEDGNFWGLNLAGQLLHLPYGKDTIDKVDIAGLDTLKGLNILIKGRFAYFLGFHKRVSLYRVDIDSFKVDKLEENIGHSRPYSYSLGGEDLYFFQRNKIMKLGIKSGIINDIPFDTRKEGKLFEFLNSLSDSIFLKTRTNQIFLLYRDSIQNVTADLNISSSIFTLREIDDRWAFSTIQGIYFYDKQLNQPNPGHILKNKRVNLIYEDKEKGNWFSLGGEGLGYCPNYKIKSFNKKNSPLIDNSITAIIQGTEKAKVIVGTTNGNIHFIDSTATIYKNLNTEKGIKIYDLLLDGDFLWIARNVGGKRLYNLKNEEFYDSNHGSSFKTMAITSNDYFYGADSNGIIKTLKGYYYKNSAAVEGGGVYNLKNLSLHRPLSLYIDQYQSRVWIGQTTALSYDDYEKDTIISFDNKGKDFLHRINKITQNAQDGSIWVATPNGVFQIEGDSVAAHWTTANGLLSNQCNTVFGDKFGQVWVGMDKGVSVIDVATKKIKHTINKSDGLLSENVQALYKTGHQAWIGTSNGLFVLDERDLRRNIVWPPIHIQKVAIWETDTAIYDEYTLAYNQNNITIEYLGICYRAQGNFQYQYRMKGIDTSWVTVSSEENFARYPQLSPGKYTFEVKTINEDGVKSKQAAAIDFVILKPFWLQWWFFILIISGIAAISGGIVYYWRSRNARENNLRRRVLQLHLEALRSQMNPHFIFNALNAIQLFLYGSDRKNAMIYLSRFADMMRYIFNQSQKEQISLTEELAFLKNYTSLEELRFGDKISVYYEVAENVDVENIYIPSLFIQPIVENSFKHGLLHKKGKGRLDIKLSMEGDYLKIIVQDDGIGREAVLKIQRRNRFRKRKGSTENIKARIDALNERMSEEKNAILFEIEDLEDNNNNQIGTKVTVKIMV